MLQLRRARVLPLTPAITRRATALMEDLTLSHGLQAADALIAATALEHQLRLLTGNTKHFAPVPGIRIEAFRI
jgi:predicted nucleic acid-binding protein